VAVVFVADLTASLSSLTLRTHDSSIKSVRALLARAAVFADLSANSNVAGVSFNKLSLM
jgi:hypothetical protein